jgi:hypothetical protein
MESLRSAYFKILVRFVSALKLIMPLTYTEVTATQFNQMNTIGFLYKVENITLQPVDDTLQLTTSFVTKDIINGINEKLKPQNYRVDEGSLRPKFIDKQLYLEGFAMEIQEPKTVGFLSGR